MLTFLCVLIILLLSIVKILNFNQNCHQIYHFVNLNAKIHKLHILRWNIWRKQQQNWGHWFRFKNSHKKPIAFNFVVKMKQQLYSTEKSQYDGLKSHWSDTLHSKIYFYHFNDKNAWQQPKTSIKLSLVILIVFVKLVF